MSKRIIKIWSLVLAVTLVVGFMLPAAPAQAVYGGQQFLTQPLPAGTALNQTNKLSNTSDVTDVAIGAGIIYAIDGSAVPGAVAGVFKSTDGGLSFTKVANPAGAVALTAVSVAPDNTSVVAVTDGVAVFISNDAGATWSALPTLVGTTWAGATIMDVAIAPARTGTLLGREYVIATANPAAGVTAISDVVIIGATATWTSAAAALNGAADFVAVAVTPNFVGDRGVVALGAQVLALGVGVRAWVINTGTAGVISVANIPAGTTSDVGAAASAITHGDIALPSDFDATTSSGRRAYVGFNSVAPQTDNDVYRIDDTSARALGAVTAQGIWSVAYAGTLSAGTLFEVRQANASLRYSTDMTGGSPTWTTTDKLLPATTTNNVVRVAPDYATSKTVYVGSTGAESAFSASTDAGVSFNQRSLIDNGVANNIGTVTGFFPEIGGTNIFMSTLDVAAGQISVWKAPAPVTDTGWERVFVATALGAGAIVPVILAGGYPTNKTLYLQDQSAAGGPIYRSSNAGATWTTRQPPTAGTVIQSTAYVDENVSYLADNAGNIYKSTNGAWTWGTPVALTAVGLIRQITPGRTDELIVGGTGNIAISKDGGATFTLTAGNPGEFYRVTKDTDYTNNNLIYLADASATTGAVYKMALGTDPTPVNMIDPNAGLAVNTLALRAGVLYAFRTLLVSRTVNPTATPGTIGWDTMLTGIPALPAGYVFNAGTTTTVAGKSIVYGRSNFAGAAAAGTAVVAYEDVLATAKLAISSPPDKRSLQIDPVTGRADMFSIVLGAVGSGTALANTYQVQVAEKALGWAGAVTSGLIVVGNPNEPEIRVGFGSPQFATTMNANTEYQYRVRVRNTISGDAVRSNWSETRTINVGAGSVVVQQTQGIQLLSPQLGTQNSSLTPAFSWAPQFGATQYEFQLAAAPFAASFANPIASAKVAEAGARPIVKLDFDRDYFWRVRVSLPVPGEWSTVANFHTMSEPVEAAPPIVIKEVPPPVINIPPAPPAQQIVIPPAPPPPAQIVPAYIWAIIIIGAVLVIAVIILIVRTRRPA